MSAFSGVHPTFEMIFVDLQEDFRSRSLETALKLLSLVRSAYSAQSEWSGASLCFDCNDSFQNTYF